MLITTIVIPTPSRIRNKLKKVCTKERIAIYSLISGGILIISLSKGEFKSLPICGLLYCGFAFEIIDRADSEVLEIIAKNTNNYYFRNF